MKISPPVDGGGGGLLAGQSRTTTEAVAAMQAERSGAPLAAVVGVAAVSGVVDQAERPGGGWQGGRCW